MANPLYTATWVSESPTGSKRSNTLFAYAPTAWATLVTDVDAVVGGDLITQSVPVYEHTGGDYPAGTDLMARVTVIDDQGLFFNYEMYDVSDREVFTAAWDDLVGDADITSEDGNPIIAVNVKYFNIGGGEYTTP